MSEDFVGLFNAYFEKGGFSFGLRRKNKERIFSRLYFPGFFRNGPLPFRNNLIGFRICLNEKSPLNMDFRCGGSSNISDFYSSHYDDGSVRKEFAVYVEREINFQPRTFCRNKNFMADLVCFLHCRRGTFGGLNRPLQIRPLLVADLNQPVGGFPKGEGEKGDENRTDQSKEAVVPVNQSQRTHVFDIQKAGEWELGILAIAIGCYFAYAISEAWAYLVFKKNKDRIDQKQPRK
jgi:hypothetical protein